MSDRKLRDLERRWKETGTVEDEAAYLLERVRVGDLTQERLELAAYCGHEGARRVIPAVPEFPLLFVLEAVERIGGRAALVRVGIEFARLTTASLPDPERQLVERQIVCAEQWLTCPCDEHALACERSCSVFGATQPVVRRLIAVLAWISDRQVKMLRPPDPMAVYLLRLIEDSVAAHPASERESLELGVLHMIVAPLMLSISAD
jgi:hypothetical protein